MKIRKIEQYGLVLKVFLTPTKEYPVGFNYFFCDSILRETIESCTLSFRGTKELRYVFIDNIGLHRFVCGLKPNDGLVADHINGVRFDNCSCNLRVVSSFENNLNRIAPNVITHKDNSFIVSYCFKEIGFITKSCFNTERDALSYCNLVERYLKEYYNCIYYNILEDRRNHHDLVNLLRLGKISESEELDLYLKRISNCTWYYFRYENDLKAYKSVFNISGIETGIGGFLVDSCGEVLSPYYHKELELLNKINSLKILEGELDKAIKALEDKKLYLKSLEIETSEFL